MRPKGTCRLCLVPSRVRQWRASARWARVLLTGAIVSGSLIALVVAFPISAMEVVVGAVISIWITLLMGAIEKPELDLMLYKPGASTRFRAGNHRGYVAQLRLRNKPIPGWVSKWLQLYRNAATQTTGTITFRNLDGEQAGKGTMGIRWSTSPQPGHWQVESTPHGEQTKRYVYDLERLTTVRAIPPGYSEDGVLDVAARYDGEGHCYGYNNESYSHDFKTPRWKLTQEQYLVDVYITASNATCRGTFRLVNRGNSETEFYLTDADE